MINGLFTDDQVQTAGKRSDFFSLEGDLSPVERNYIADLLVDHYRDNEYNFKKATALIRRVDRFRNCGSEGSRRPCPSCSINFYTRYFCKHRICDVCARIYGKVIRDKVTRLINPVFANRKKGWTVAMLTLSESSGKYRGRYPNREEYRRFNQNVSTFCRLFYGKFRGTWTRTGKVREDRKHFLGAGWFAVNEFGQDNNNLHSHILIYGPWIPHSKLLAAWIKITGGDRGCYIEPMQKPSVAIRYVSKYITKPPRFLDPSVAVKFVVASKSQRRIRSGGIFYNQIKIEKGDRHPDTCPFCLVNLAYGGVCDLLETTDGINLSYVRKHREEFERESFREILCLLPGGTIPAGLPEWPSLLPN